MAAYSKFLAHRPLPLHKFSGSVATIGRHDECDVVLDSPAVSRYHVKIFCENNRYFVEDLNSRNGTSVNGEVIRSRTLLNNGDQIEISTLPFRFSRKIRSTRIRQLGHQASGRERFAWADVDEGSLRRKEVATGDQISNKELGTDTVNQKQIIGRVQLADGGGAWPVINNPTVKLNQTLRLLYSLRQTIRISDVYSRTLQVLFDIFPAAARISILLRNPQERAFEVGAAVTRQTRRRSANLPAADTHGDAGDRSLFVR